MAAKEDKFPVVLEKDGVKRTAYSPVSYNQLKTQGFAEPKKRTASSAKKAEDKADEPKTESKTDSKK